MRITGGKARGIPISTGRATHVRPATDRMREAVFSSVANHISGASVLDLFAGSGGYGLEALSRGADSVLFVEKHPQAIAALQQNLKAVLKSLGNPDEVETHIVRRDVLRFTSSMKFSCIFMDPPYDLVRSSGEQLLAGIKDFIKEDGLVVYEMPGDLPAPGSGWNCLRKIGKSGTNEPSALILQPVPDAQ